MQQTEPKVPLKEQYWVPQLWFENKKREVEEMHRMSRCLVKWLPTRKWLPH